MLHKIYDLPSFDSRSCDWIRKAGPFIVRFGPIPFGHCIPLKNRTKKPTVEDKDHTEKAIVKDSEG